MNGHLQKLREILYGEPSSAQWAALCALMDVMGEGAGLEAGLEYALPLLRGWPSALRQAPRHWGHDDPRRRLALDLSPLEARSLRAEAEIVWDEPLEGLDYVRERRVRAHAAGHAPRWMGEGRRVGYARHDVERFNRFRARGLLKRVFVLLPYDRDSDREGVYASSLPPEAVDPRTVRPGVLGWQTSRARDGVVVERSAADEALGELRAQWEGCARCRLHRRRHQLVFGSGQAQADLAIIAEAPGREDERLGLPLVGRRRKLLRRVLTLVGRRRPEVFITTLVKCRPTDARGCAPESALVACEPLWRAQLRLVKPRVVLALGQVASTALTGDPNDIELMRGRLYTLEDGVRVVPTFSLRDALDDPSARPAFWEDCRRVGALLMS